MFCEEKTNAAIPKEKSGENYYKKNIFNQLKIILLVSTVI